MNINTHTLEQWMKSVMDRSAGSQWALWGASVLNKLILYNNQCTYSSVKSLTKVRMSTFKHWLNSSRLWSSLVTVCVILGSPEILLIGPWTPRASYHSRPIKCLRRPQNNPDRDKIKLKSTADKWSTCTYIFWRKQGIQITRWITSLIHWSYQLKYQCTVYYKSTVKLKVWKPSRFTCI